MRSSHVFAHGSSATLHVLLGMWLLWLPSTVPRLGLVRAGQTPDPTQVFIVPQVEPPALPGLNPIDTSQDDSLIRRGEPSELSFPGFTFDFSKVGNRATLLFPFLSPGLSLRQFALTPRRENAVRDRFASAAATGPDSANKPPLVLGDAPLQSLIDQCWSRRDRWAAFQPLLKLADRYDPDAGKLPVLFQRYVEQNGLQPYVDTSIRDPRLWVELGLAADHVDFIGFVSRYAAEHPSTKATTELLFLLDKLVQASLDALVTLLEIDPKRDLDWTRKVNGGAFKLIADLRLYYKAQLERKGIAPGEALRTYYSQVRVSILDGILRTTPDGYRASDARFLIGTIHWTQGDVAAALQSWRGMTIDPADSYVKAYSDILAAIRDSSGGTGAKVDATRVYRALDAEHSRWVSSSIDRLHRFGHHFDTF